jgi:hypothetical protein
MADPRMFDTAVAVAQDEALAAINHLLADIPEAQQPFAERYGNPNLPGSSATLVEAAANDHQVRAVHGLSIMGQGSAHVLTALLQRIEELEATVKPAKAAKAKPKATTKR